MQRVRVLVLFVPIVLFSCSTPELTFVTKDYSGRSMTRASLAVNMPLRELLLSNSDDVVDDLGEGNADSVYYNFFRQEMPTALLSISYCTKVTVTRELWDSSFVPKKFQLATKETFTVRLPPDSTVFPDTAQYILFIQGLKSYRESMSFMGTPVGGSTNSSLVHQLTFFIWDNRHGKLVSYGYPNGSSSFRFGMSKSDWRTTLKKLARAIMSNSPFYMKS